MSWIKKTFQAAAARWRKRQSIGTTLPILEGPIVDPEPILEAAAEPEDPSVLPFTQEATEAFRESVGENGDTAPDILADAEEAPPSPTRIVYKDYPSDKNLGQMVDRDLKPLGEKLAYTPCLICDNDPAMLGAWPVEDRYREVVQVPEGANRVYYYNFCEECSKARDKASILLLLQFQQDARERGALEMPLYSM